MTFRETLRQRAATTSGTVVLAEGWDERVRTAAAEIEHDGIAEVVVLDRSTSGDPRIALVAELLLARKPDKVRGMQQALELANDPIRLAAGLVALVEVAFGRCWPRPP